MVGNGTSFEITTDFDHLIPAGAFVTLTVHTGTYQSGDSATINSGPFQIVSGRVAASATPSMRNFTFTTASNHGIPVGGSITIINRLSFFYGVTVSTALNGTYIAAAGTTGMTLVFEASLIPNPSIGELRIQDMSVRNNNGTTGYYNVVSSSSRTLMLTAFRSRSSGPLGNLMATLQYGQIPFTSARLLASSGTFTATILTPLNHGIPSGAQFGVCSNNSLHLPFQTSVRPSNPPNSAAIRVATVSTTEGTFQMNVSANPFYIGSVSTRTYSGVGPIRVTLFPGTRVGSRDLTTVETFANLFTQAGSDATRIIVPLLAGAVTGNSVTMFSQSILVDSISTNPRNSSYINISGVTNLSSTTNIVSYNMNRGLGTEIAEMFMNMDTTPFSSGHTPNVNNGYILYPLRGCALENKSLGTALNSSQMTIIWASCLRQNYSRNNFSLTNTSNQPPVISAAVNTNGSGGGDSSGRDFKIITWSNGIDTPRISLIRNNTSVQISPNLSTSSLTSNTSDFRINHVIMNFTNTAVDDIAANTYAIGINGWGYASQFQNLSTSVSQGGENSVTLIPGHLRIGADTSATTTYTNYPLTAIELKP
jgi:hypothetical protein